MEFKVQKSPVEAGLHFISTPIGAARDITLRALDLLACGDVLAAEDTRSLRSLMEIHGLSLGGRPLISYHEHSGDGATAKLLTALSQGKSVIYASEAGTPLVADPGFQLARAVIAAGHVVRAAPGPSAVLGALTVSGLPSDRFLFAGFAPAAGAARMQFLQELAPLKATIILYESPKRVQKTLDDLRRIFGPQRQMALCRELTKKFEEILRGTVAEVAELMADREVKGEIVLVLDRAPDELIADDRLEEALRAALKEHRIKDAAAIVAESFGVPKRDVYQKALEMVKMRDG